MSIDPRLTHLLLEQAPDAIVGIDGEGRIALVNAQVERWFGYDRQELLGRPIEVLVPERLRGRHAAHRRGYADQPTTRPMGASLDLLGRRRDGSEFPVEISLSPTGGVSGLAVMAILRDVTERRRQQERLAYLADHDDLTGLLNRRAFMRELGDHLARADRYGDHGSLLLLDLDHFKAVNDTQGHQAGDAVLVDVADVLACRARHTDRLGRLGGDEFAVLLPGTGHDHAAGVADAIIGAVRRTANPVTASIGLVGLERHATADAAFAAADLALYTAKHGGRNRVSDHCADAPAAPPAVGP